MIVCAKKTKQLILASFHPHILNILSSEKDNFSNYRPCESILIYTNSKNYFC